jgi:hypothetical protein
VGWSEVAAAHYLAGERRKRLRSYVKSVSSGAWQYVSWLAHDRQGSGHEALVGAEIVQHVVVRVSELLLGSEPAPVACPKCRSRRMSSDVDYYDDGYESVALCEVCGWRSELEWTDFVPPERAPRRTSKGHARQGVMAQGGRSTVEVKSPLPPTSIA